MIGKEELARIARSAGLNLYQQEKDYLLKLFLYSYYKHFSDAVFKGGTCLAYIMGLNRFSEDLDFNIKHPKKMREQVRRVLKEIGKLGIESYFIMEELFSDSYACEIGFSGPLFSGTSQTQNKFRIDAGLRTGTLRKPEWKMIRSDYPETGENFLVLAMDPQEMLAEKIIALAGRRKGRDLYDVWFMLNSNVALDKKLLRRKGFSKISFPTKAEYERDILRLAKTAVPYEQVKKEVVSIIKKLS